MRYGTDKKELLWVTAIFTLIATVLLFLMWHSPDKHIDSDYYWVLGFCIYIILSTLFDLNLYKRMLFGRLLGPLAKNGFEIENVNDYWGYKGIFRGYFIRICYLPLRHIDEIRINVYFNSGDKSPVELRDVYNRLSWVYSYKIIKYGTSRVEKNSIQVYAKTASIFSFSQVMNRIDSAIDLVVKEELTPMTEEEVNALLLAEPKLYAL